MDLVRTKILPLLLLLMTSSSVYGSDVTGTGELATGDEVPEARTYDPDRIASLDVDGALIAAGITGKNVLLVLGGNWCHDSRAMAGRLEEEPLSSFVDRTFHLVYVDVGRRDRNLEIAKRFGIMTLLGTPTILIVSSEGVLLNAETVHDWRDAHSRSLQELQAYMELYSE